MEIEGNLVDVRELELRPARVTVEGGEIADVTGIDDADGYLAPAFIDCHIHIESSMLCPSRFAEAVVPHGTGAVVTDPHEIANVAGIDGVDYMRRDAAGVPLRTYLTAPSCVPATPFETSGAKLGPDEVAEILAWDEVVALGEVMNWPGVVEDHPDIIAKLEAARDADLPIDGHAPGLPDDALKAYADHGIQTCHESTSYEEARAKHDLGMLVQVRQGSASKDLAACHELMDEVDTALVSDDKHGHELTEGHLDTTIAEAIELGVDPLRAYRAATWVPADHYDLPGGAIEAGRAADLVVLDDLETVDVRRTIIGGEVVAEDGQATFAPEPTAFDAHVDLDGVTPEDLVVPFDYDRAKVRVIEAKDGSIRTEKGTAVLPAGDGNVPPEPGQDVLKLAVVSRYGNDDVGRAFVRGFGLEEGALAGTVGHDSHNVICVGATEEAMADAINLLVDEGGFAAVGPSQQEHLPLPVAGLMTTDDQPTVDATLAKLQDVAADLGCRMSAPFMTLSFLPLLVIPKLKLSDQGLFDAEGFEFVDVTMAG